MTKKYGFNKVTADSCCYCCWCWRRNSDQEVLHENEETKNNNNWVRSISRDSMCPDNFEWGAVCSSFTARTNTCQSLRIRFLYRIAACIRHTQKKSHTPPLTCALLVEHNIIQLSAQCTYSKIFYLFQWTDRPASQYRLAFALILGFWYSEWLIHFTFWTASCRESGRQAHTVYVQSLSNKKYKRLIWRNSQFVHTQWNYLQCVFDALRTNYRFHLISLTRFFSIFCEFICIARIVYLFVWTIIDFGVRCACVHVMYGYDLIE